MYAFFFGVYQKKEPIGDFTFKDIWQLWFEFNKPKKRHDKYIVLKTNPLIQKHKNTQPYINLQHPKIQISTWFVLQRSTATAASINFIFKQSHSSQKINKMTP